MVPGIDPKVDFAFKRVFGTEHHEPITIHLLNSVLQSPPAHKITSLDLLNPFSDKDSLDDKLSILDIKARDQMGRQLNVEMQILAFQVFRPRVLYYWAKFHQAQLQEVMGYHRLRPTVSVCFVDTILFPDVVDFHLVFELTERRHHFAFSEQIQLHILELPKFTKSPAELATPLDAWLYFLRHAQQVDTDHLPAPLAIPEIQQGLGVLLMMSQTDLERERYEARLKAQRDAWALADDAATAEERGLQRGLERGLQQGLQQSLQQGLVHQAQFVQRLLQKSLTPEADLLALSVDDLKRLVEQLQAELLSQRSPPG